MESHSSGHVSGMVVVVVGQPSEGHSSGIVVVGGSGTVVVGSGIVVGGVVTVVGGGSQPGLQSGVPSSPGSQLQSPA